MQSDINTLKATTERIEDKLNLVHGHTAKMEEYHTITQIEIKDIKDHLHFNTFKIAENEKEIFKLKQNK